MIFLHLLNCSRRSSTGAEAVKYYGLGDFNFMIVDSLFQDSQFISDYNFKIANSLVTTRSLMSKNANDHRFQCCLQIH